MKPVIHNEVVNHEARRKPALLQRIGNVAANTIAKVSTTSALKAEAAINERDKRFAAQYKLATTIDALESIIEAPLNNGKTRAEATFQRSAKVTATAKIENPLDTTQTNWLLNVVSETGVKTDFIVDKRTLAPANHEAAFGDYSIDVTVQNPKTGKQYPADSYSPQEQLELYATVTSAFNSLNYAAAHDRLTVTQLTTNTPVTH